MELFNQIPIWENKRRLKLLKEFRGLVVTYYKNSEYSSMAGSLIENPLAETTREQINRKLNPVHPVVISADVSPVIGWRAPPVAGGFYENVDVLFNVLNLGHYQLSDEVAIDHLDQAIGVYEADQFRSWVRTFNPFWWANYLLMRISALPFKFLGQLGFNEKKAEETVIGKLVRGILYLIPVIAGFLTILDRMDWLETFKGFWK